MKISLITPTYNEAGNLPNLIKSLFSLPLEDLHVLIIDDNSSDGTGQIADDLVKKNLNKLEVIHRSGKLGLGSAYIAGFRHVLPGDSDVIGQMDADFSHDPLKLVELADAVKNCDIAIGSRYVPGGSVDRDWPLWRKLLSGFGNSYARTILSLPIHDTTGGFRLWRREVIAALPLDRIQSNGYVFQVELAYIAHRLGFNFKEVPIYFAERRYGQSKMSFRIQMEAALRVWSLLFDYRDLKSVK